jgi:hypothetical protein
MRPPHNIKLHTQSNVKMPMLTGIADAILQDKQKCIYEIKASVKQDWKEDAFVQAFCYAIMLGQAWFTIKLVNLFKNSRIEYVVYIDDVKKLRQTLLYDILVWNMSSYMAKHYRPLNILPSSHTIDLDETVFINMEWNVLLDKPSEIVVMRMLSPTRFHIDFLTDSLDDLNNFLNTFIFTQYLFCGHQKLFEKIKLKDEKKDMSLLMEVYPFLQGVASDVSETEKNALVDTNKKVPSLPSTNIVLKIMNYVSDILVPTTAV